MRLKKTGMCLGMCIIMCMMSMGAVEDTSVKEVSVTYVDGFSGTQSAHTYKTRQKTVESFFEEAGIEKGVYDKLNRDEHSFVVDGADIIITKGMPVTVFYNDHIVTAITTKPTVSETLLEAGLMPGENDLVSPSADTEVFEHMVIRVTLVNEKEAFQTEPIDYETRFIEDSTIEKGKTKVISEGEKGSVKIRYAMTYHDGELVSKTEKERTVLKEPVDRVVASGTKETVKATPSPVPKKTADTTSAATGAKAKESAGSSVKAAASTAKTENSGVINGLKYTKKLSMTATAYSAFNSSGGYARTASGALARKGIVAVDKRVIPLGTRLYIEGYGEAVAGDVGGAIKGNKIDLCFEDTNANLRSFGRQKVQVYILE